MEKMGYEKVALEDYALACKMGSGLACSNQRRLSENK
jgi:hypothetical protein